MMRSAGIAAAMLLGFLAGACGSYAATTSQTQIWSDPGTSGTAGDIAIRDAVLVADDEGQRATLYAAFANMAGADAVLHVRVGDVEAVPAGGPLVIPTQGYAALSPDAVRLDVDGADSVPGYFVEVEFVFAEAPRTTLDVLVRSDDGYYAGSLD